MKRHTVMDLFHKHQTEPVDGPWNDGEKELPKGDECKVKVRTTSGEEMLAYYYRDMGRLEGYMECKTHFWCCATHQPVFNVTHWIGLK